MHIVDILFPRGECSRQRLAINRELTKTSAIEATVGRGRLELNLLIGALWDESSGRGIELDLVNSFRSSPWDKGARGFDAL